MASTSRVPHFRMVRRFRNSSPVTAMMRRRRYVNDRRKAPRASLSLRTIPTRQKARLRTGWRTAFPADGNALRATAGKTLKNDFGRKGYGGPCPPPGHGKHRYYFTVYAVDASALDIAGDSRDDLEAALKD